MKRVNEGPWYVNEWPPKQPGEQKRVVLQSDDFTHDVALMITGDFESHEDMVQYAKQLADRMNQMPGTRPFKWFKNETN